MLTTLFLTYIQRARFTAVVFTLAASLAILSTVPANAAGEREVIARVKPVYPVLAERMKIAGTVSLEATVEPNGHVKLVRTVMGNSLLSEAAKEAVKHWKFAPADFETIEQIDVNFPN
jgi:TonB family protein